MSAPYWAEEVTAIATAVGAVGLVSAIGAMVFAARQVREAQQSRQAQMAADFLAGCRRTDQERSAAAGVRTRPAMPTAAALEPG